MAKKRKTKSKERQQRDLERAQRKAHTPQPYRHARRLGLHFALLGTANVLKNLRNANLAGDLFERNYNSLDDKEARQLQKARMDIYKAERRLRWIMERVDRESE